jgi:hypothetical protein
MQRAAICSLVKSASIKRSMETICTIVATCNFRYLILGDLVSEWQKNRERFLISGFNDPVIISSSLLHFFLT